MMLHPVDVKRNRYGAMVYALESAGVFEFAKKIGVAGFHHQTAKMFDEGVENKKWAGYYCPSTRGIYLNEEKVTARMVLHEIGHDIERGKHLTKKGCEDAADLQALKLARKFGVSTCSDHWFPDPPEGFTFVIEGKEKPWKRVKEHCQKPEDEVVMGPDVICPICGTGPTMWMGCECGATPEKAMYKSDLDALNALKEGVA